MPKRLVGLLMLVVLMSLLAGCGGLPTDVTPDDPADVTVAATATLAPESTVEPSVTPAPPTATPKPEVPTNTPESTSTPLPTVAPTPAAAVPPRVRNNAPAGTAAAYAEGEVIANDNFLFRMAVLDTRKGDKDGDGIDYVEFFVRTEDFDEIYSRRENNAGYCIFGGGEPNCNTWPKRDGQFVWGGDGPEVQPGKYFVSILVTPKDQDFEGEVWNWDFDITVELP